MVHMETIERSIIARALRKKNITEKDIASIKRSVLSKTGNKHIPSHVALLKTYRAMIQNGEAPADPALSEVLKKRKVRTLSGIASVSVILPSFPCPGKCLFCPTEKGLPKSYLRDEPAVMRAIANDFDPYRQTKARIEALQRAGHSTEKIELIIIGGTWSYYPKKYRLWFVSRCLDAANQSTGVKKIYTPGAPLPRSEARLTKQLLAAQDKNEHARNRIVGITAETRPDHIDTKEIALLRLAGVTRVELGVQSIDEDVLKKNTRGHGIGAIVEATSLLKDSGFKVTYHIMPGLYGSTPKKDLVAFKKMFDDPRFKPDYLKIYPCVVLKHSPLFRLYKQHRYVPYTTETLITLLARCKKEVPYYTRIIRVIRDVPSPDVVAGNKISNLREHVKLFMKKRDWQCRCIRCREIKGASVVNKNMRMFRTDYDASDGKEIFLSFEDAGRRHLFAFLRLRIPSLRSPLKLFGRHSKNHGLVRELHTYGVALPVGTKKASASQHRGLGKRLLKEAEQIAQNDFAMTHLAVISGIGVRSYYKKFGYHINNTYMVKSLSDK
jgi:elongator complex protein 3